MGIPRQNYSRDIYSLWSSGATVAHRIPDPKVASSNLGMCKLRLKATGLAHPLTPSLSNVFHQKSASVNFAPKSESHRQQTQPIFFFLDPTNRFDFCSAMVLVRSARRRDPSTPRVPLRQHHVHQPARAGSFRRRG